MCAFALAATPALAHEFIASKTGKTTRHRAKPNRRSNSGRSKSNAEKASAKGAVAAGSSRTYATSIKYAKCMTDGENRQPKRRSYCRRNSLTPLAVEYHANGFVETGSEIEEVEGKAVLAGGIGGTQSQHRRKPKNTKVQMQHLWPEQTIPLKADKRTGRRILVGHVHQRTGDPKPVERKTSPRPQTALHHHRNSFKGIKYEFEGEPCEEWGKEEGPEGGGGTYFGSFPQILTAGNLEFG